SGGMRDVAGGVGWSFPLMYICPVCEVLQPSCDYERCICAKIEAPVPLIPCPYCAGPPAPTHHERRLAAGPNRMHRFLQRLRLRPLTICVDAYVFCHECGAQSPKAEGFPEDTEELKELLPRLMERAVLLWNTRNERHKWLYAANEEHGNNIYP